MIVVVLMGVAIAAGGAFILAGGGRRGSPALGYGLILGGMIVVLVAALAMFGVIRE